MGSKECCLRVLNLCHHDQPHKHLHEHYPHHGYCAGGCTITKTRFTHLWKSIHPPVIPRQEARMTQRAVVPLCMRLLLWIEFRVARFNQQSPRKKKFVKKKNAKEGKRRNYAQKLYPSLTACNPASSCIVNTGACSINTMSWGGY